MRIAKYFWTLCIILTLVIALSGCGYNNSIDHDGEDDASQKQTTEKSTNVTDDTTVTTITQTIETSQAEDNTRILFTAELDGTSGIAVINADGSNLQRLVDGHTSSVFPNKSQFVCASQHGSEWEICIIDADEFSKQLIAEFDEDIGVSSVVVSPDGARIAYVLTHVVYPVNDQLYLMQVDGTNRTLIVEKDAYIIDPYFSLDGSKILFSVEYGADTYETYTINADGSHLRLLPDGSGHSFSPDSSKILYTSSQEIFIIDADGSNKSVLSDGWEPMFSPDGSKIIFVSDRNNAYGLYIMDVDGSNQTQLTEHDARIDKISFSPDGSKILFVSERDNACGLYIVNIDGSSQTQLAEHQAWIYEPSFSPDGSMIIYLRKDGIYIMNADGSNKRFLIKGHTPFFISEDE